jgi:antitoxin (DNA-binding transcriptional repressor) of toxin-antitoxin stability system
VRELREHASQIWRDLSGEGEIVVTLNGKPVGVITPTGADSLDADLRALRRARAVQAVAGMQAHAVRKGLDRLSQEEIEAEIEHSRRSR